MKNCEPAAVHHDGDPIGIKLRVIDHTSSDARIFAPKVAGWLNDKKHMRYSEQRFRIHSAESVLNDWRNRFTTFLAILDDGDEILGTISATPDYHNKTIDLGVLIGPEFKKRGLATGAWRLAMWLYSGAYVKKIEAGCMANNKAMIKIFKRSGMKYEGRRIKHFQFSKTKRVDVVYYGKFK